MEEYFTPYRSSVRYTPDTLLWKAEQKLNGMNLKELQEDEERLRKEFEDGDG